MGNKISSKASLNKYGDFWLHKVLDGAASSEYHPEESKWITEGTRVKTNVFWKDCAIAFRSRQKPMNEIVATSMNQCALNGKILKRESGCIQAAVLADLLAIASQLQSRFPKDISYHRWEELGGVYQLMRLGWPRRPTHRPIRCFSRVASSPLQDYEKVDSIIPSWEDIYTEIFQESLA